MSDTNSEVEKDCPQVGHNNNDEENIRYVSIYHPQIQPTRRYAKIDDCPTCHHDRKIHSTRMNTTTENCLASPRYRQRQPTRRHTNTNECLTSPCCRQTQPTRMHANTEDCPKCHHNRKIQSARINTNTEDCFVSPCYRQMQHTRIYKNTEDCLRSPHYQQIQPARMHTNTEDWLTGTQSHSISTRKTRYNYKATANEHTCLKPRSDCLPTGSTINTVEAKINLDTSQYDVKLKTTVHTSQRMSVIDSAETETSLILKQHNNTRRIKSTKESQLLENFKIFDILRNIWSEDTVKKRRSFFDVRDDISDRHLDKKAITVGSFAEGVYQAHDIIDVVFVLKWIKIACTIEQSLVTDEPVVFVELDYCYAGFVFLKILSGLDFELFFECCIHQEETKYLSSHHFQLHISRTSENATLKNHRFTDSDETCTFMFGVPSSWPMELSEFRERIRKYGWPRKDMISNIMENGVILLPIGHQKSPKGKLQWQISFVSAEKMLVRSFSHVQFLTFVLMKLVVLDHFKHYPLTHEFSLSLITKIVMFWVLEETNESLWTAMTFLDNFYSCFGKFRSFIDSGFLPNYFIPKQNMFESHASPTLLLQFREIQTPTTTKLLCFVKKRFHSDIPQQTPSLRMLPVHLPFFSFLPLLQVSSTLVDWQCFLECTVYKIMMNMSNHFVHNLYCYHLIQQCQMASHHAPNQVGGNKAAYKGLRSRMCFLTMGTYIDSVSGWILMAFHFYRLKQYNLCTRILRHIELVLKSGRLIHMEMGNYTKEGLNKSRYLYRQKRISFLRELKLFSIQPVMVPQGSDLIPREILVSKDVEFHYVSPEVLTYYLKFLCAVESGNVTLCPEILIAAQEATMIRSEKTREMQLTSQNIFKIMTQTLDEHFQ